MTSGVEKNFLLFFSARSKREALLRIHPLVRARLRASKIADLSLIEARLSRELADRT
jgi:hypothetical protein